MNITQKHVRNAMIALGLAVAATSSYAQLSMNFDIPGGQIGVNLSSYPQLQPIPGYPVYYAPGMNSNYFFYDGLYWVYDGSNWYASSWYNGPWSLVDPLSVPVYVLRVPVRYYRSPPTYFRGWSASDAPHWGDHWGQSWSSHRAGWDHWNRGSAPAPAPLPTYQRQYSGNRYPQQQSQQASLEARNYRYQPRDQVAQQHFEHTRTQAQPAQAQQSSQAAREQHAREQQNVRQGEQRNAQPQQASHPQPQQAPRPQPQQAQREQPRPQAQAPERAQAPQQAQAPHIEHPQQTNERNNERNQANNGQGG